MDIYIPIRLTMQEQASVIVAVTTILQYAGLLTTDDAETINAIAEDAPHLSL